MYGVLDRIEDNDLAVILIEEFGDQFVVPVRELPSESEEGTWFTVERRNDEYIIIAIDEEKTKREQKKSSDLLNQLREKNSDSRFKRRN